VARFALARCLTARGEDQKARATVLKELIEHHIEEEEKEMFPKVQKGIPSEELESLGARMEAMFEKAVEMGLEALVVSDQSVRSPNGAMNGLTNRRPPSRQVRATR